MLRIPGELYDAMIDHARQEYPLECCGLLAGLKETATRLYRLRNQLASPIAYSADPHELFAAQREMRQDQLELVAIYHSHPATEARPSRHDIAQNYYGPVPRIIVSLAGPEPVVRAYRLSDQHFEELECNRTDA